jgi:hypothetical protein
MRTDTRDCGGDQQSSAWRRFNKPASCYCRLAAAAEDGVSLDPDVCGIQHTADISVVEQRCKMVCPPGSVYADYHPNQVCTYLWTHAGNALTLIYPEGLQATLDIRR